MESLLKDQKIQTNTWNGVDIHFYAKRFKQAEFVRVIKISVCP